MVGRRRIFTGGRISSCVWSREALPTARAIGRTRDSTWGHGLSPPGIPEPLVPSTLAETALIGDLKHVLRYLSGPELRTATRQRVLAAIGHSLDPPFLRHNLPESGQDIRTIQELLQGPRT
jgi:hypothetical protein